MSRYLPYIGQNTRDYKISVKDESCTVKRHYDVIYVHIFLL